MKYTSGDIWNLATDLDGWVVVTTNTVIRSDDKAVMGAGIAKEAARRFPELPLQLANHIKLFKDRIYVHNPVICLPTKRDWRFPSRIKWIQNGCLELRDMARILSSIGDNRPILLPRLGCGHGGLNWEREVRPLVDSILEDDRFILVTNDE